MTDASKTKTPDRRLAIDRRQFSYTNYYPEKRSGKDRRESINRRVNQDVEIEIESKASAPLKGIITKYLSYILKYRKVEIRIIPCGIKNLANSFSLKNMILFFHR